MLQFHSNSKTRQVLDGKSCSKSPEAKPKSMSDMMMVDSRGRLIEFGGITVPLEGFAEENAMRLRCRYSSSGEDCRFWTSCDRFGSLILLIQSDRRPGKRSHIILQRKRWSSASCGIKEGVCRRIPDCRKGLDTSSSGDHGYRSAEQNSRPRVPLREAPGFPASSPAPENSFPFRSNNPPRGLSRPMHVLKHPPPMQHFRSAPKSSLGGMNGNEAKLSSKI